MQFLSAFLFPGLFSLVDLVDPNVRLNEKLKFSKVFFYFTAGKSCSTRFVYSYVKPSSKHSKAKMAF